MSKIFYPATVVNNEDPMMLGRIRAYPYDQNVESILKGYNFQEGKDEFTEKDPFVILPLLPMFLSQVPLVNERITVILQNSEKRYQDAYYIQGAFSSPMTLPFENAQAANKNTSLGYRIRNSLALKNQNGQLKKPTTTFGIFPELDDVSILGRGTSDIIVKEKSVLIRAGKTFELKVNKFPVANEKMAYIQVSSFNTKIAKGKPQDLLTLNTLNKHVKYLIEWNVYNLENKENSFTGDIILYKLKENTATYSDKISYDSDLNDLRFLVFNQPFQGQTSENAILIINSFINKINQGTFPNGSSLGNERFPFVYRPNQTVRELLQPGNIDAGEPIIFSNAAKFIGGITLNAGTGPNSYNFGLVSSKDTIGVLS